MKELKEINIHGLITIHINLESLTLNNTEKDSDIRTRKREGREGRRERKREGETDRQTDIYYRNWLSHFWKLGGLSICHLQAVEPGCE